jgi:ribosomal protein S18 acetylase RimI-like enzyme
MGNRRGNEMKIVREQFSFESNLDEVRLLQLEIYRQTGELHYLIPTKIENEKFGPCGHEYSSKDDKAIKIWRGSNSEVIAVSHRGSAGNYHIEIHPDHKHMEKELFIEIEKLEKEVVGDNKSRMYTYTVSSDTDRPTVLTELGYEDYGLHEYNYLFPLDSKIPENPLPEGFTFRDLTNVEDYPKYIEVIGSVYEHCRKNMTLDKMKFMTQAEFFHPDLFLAAVDDTGMFVGFCMYRLDPLSQIVEMESLDTHPDFNNLGIEQALLSEGLRRLKKYAPNLICTVEVNLDDPWNQFLESAGFIRSVTMNMWGKHPS